MANTTFQGVVRTYGGGGKGVSTPAPVTTTVQFACDPTAASATNVRIGTSSSSGETLVIPAGAIILSVQTIQAAAGIVNEAPVDVKGEITGANGALIVAGGIAAQATVTAKVGASAATSGTFVGALTYAMSNDGVE